MGFEHGDSLKTEPKACKETTSVDCSVDGKVNEVYVKITGDIIHHTSITWTMFNQAHLQE